MTNEWAEPKIDVAVSTHTIYKYVYSNECIFNCFVQKRVSQSKG